MSGLEITGVVLGVIPLFIAVSKAYGRQIGAVKHAASSKKSAQDIPPFIHKLKHLTKSVEEELDNLISCLSTLSQAEKEDFKTRDLVQWTENTHAELSRALQIFFPRPGDYEAFQRIIKGVMHALYRLVTKSRFLNIEQLQRKDPLKMIQKLKELQRDYNVSQMEFSERFKFFRSERGLNKCLKGLDYWRLELEKLMKKATPGRLTLSPPSPVVGPLPSYTPVREITKCLFASLHDRWDCNCVSANTALLSAHEARFSLADCVCPGTLSQDILEVGFHFIISTVAGQMARQWVEALVTAPIDARKVQGMYKDKESVTQICVATTRLADTPRCWTLVVERADPSLAQTQCSKVWRTHPCDKRFHPPGGLETARSLKAWLADPKNRPPEADIRILARTLSYSLLQLHESPWLGKQWNKNHLFFLCKPNGLPDLHKPYMNISFDEFPQTIETSNMDVMHSNPGILNLGILLIELHEWSPLDTPATEISLSALEERVKLWQGYTPAYQEAIISCLRLNNWVKAGVRVDLEDDAVQQGMYQNIIHRLESEVVPDGPWRGYRS
ncbi:hypothetical protein QBC35DRAFT_31080 [Podospora australis]|uniref:DUF7580 domain-containing protein n=1 Tax=Podospora australis TaxID=1536484 RepID=A0AAN7AGM0_9PEZI|nr:hypothetical protein QBC35DRAFT_31080 [Podospora australis]